jgi:hypothetical protein
LILRTTAYRRFGSRQARRRTGVQSAAAVVIATAAVGLAACGSSSSTTTSAAVVAYQKAANAVCTAATKNAKPLTQRMTAVEQTKHLPTLADQKALIGDQVKLQKDLAAVTPPAEIKTQVAAANAQFAQLVARSTTLLAQHGNQTIAYVAIDPQLNTLGKSLQAKFKALGLSSCG